MNDILASPLRLLSVLFVPAAAAILAAWWWMGHPVAIDGGQAGGDRLYCVSYAPFRGLQTPLDPTTHIDPAQIDEDLARLSRLTDCVRTYSVQNGLDRVAEIARRHGMKVIQGLWLSSHADKNQREIATTIAIARAFPDVIQAIVVGNEVLLRGEMAAPDLAAIIRNVKARVSVPVTYADVWEFWLRHREVYDAVDFVTIHILPYWEDFPVRAADAVAHVSAIRRQMVAAFPDKEILIGETGWPSAGRMREGALPSLVNEASVVQGILALAKKEGFRVNVIEAFDQPWKRALEGTVGGHWGLLDANSRDFKFPWNAPVSEHPFWRWQAGIGIGFAFVIFAIAAAARKPSLHSSASRCFGVAVSAVVAGMFLGLVLEKAPVESLGIGGWLRTIALILVAIAASLLGPIALMRENNLPGFSNLLARHGGRGHGKLLLGLAAISIATAILSVQIALGLDFDPRYRDFPFAPLSMAIVPLAVLSLLSPGDDPPGTAEKSVAFMLALSAIYVIFNEGFVNWQALWIAGLFLVFALTLSPLRAAQS